MDSTIRRVVERQLYGRGEEEAENHVDIVGESFVTLFMERHEVDHHVCLVVADGDGDIALVYDAERNCCVWRARAYLLDIGNTQDDHRPSLVAVVTWPLVGIGDVTQEIVRDAQLVLQELGIILIGTRHLHPTVRSPLLYCVQTVLCIPKGSHVNTILMQIARFYPQIYKKVKNEAGKRRYFLSKYLAFCPLS